MSIPNGRPVVPIGPGHQAGLTMYRNDGSPRRSQDRSMPCRRFTDNTITGNQVRSVLLLTPVVPIVAALHPCPKIGRDAAQAGSNLFSHGRCKGTHPVDQRAQMRGLHPDKPGKGFLADSPFFQLPSQDIARMDGRSRRDIVYPMPSLISCFHSAYHQFQSV